MTKEKQSRIATSGGTEMTFTEIDPNVTLIAPNLMASATMILSSNIDDNEVQSKFTYQ
jgi:hypothetical protein